MTARRSAQLAQIIRQESQKVAGLQWLTNLEKQSESCINCGWPLDTATPCFGHCTRCIPPVYAANIHTEEDLKEYQRACGADV